MLSNNLDIVFYDGDCGFCNRTVQFILKNEQDDSIHFAAQQSEFASNFFEENKRTLDLSTVYFFSNGTLYSEAEAVFEIAKHVKFKYRIIRIFRVIPIAISNKLYRSIARRRHSLHKAFCFVPNELQRSRFLS